MALAERALIPAAASTDIVIVSVEEHPRLRGAAYSLQRRHSRRCA
jgi:hypothetical protein